MKTVINIIKAEQVQSGRILFFNYLFTCTYSPVISSEYSEFYRISLGDLHPEIQMYSHLNKKRWKHNGPIREQSSMHPHSLQGWKVDQLGFHLSFLKGCISGCRSLNEMGVKCTVFKNNHSVRVFSYYKCNFGLELLMIYFINVPKKCWHTLYS